MGQRRSQPRHLCLPNDVATSLARALGPNYKRREYRLTLVHALSLVDASQDGWLTRDYSFRTTDVFSESRIATKPGTAAKTQSYNTARVRDAVSELNHAMLEVNGKLVRVFASISYRRGAITFRLNSGAKDLFVAFPKTPRGGYAKVCVPQFASLKTRWDHSLYSFAIACRKYKPDADGWVKREFSLAAIHGAFGVKPSNGKRPSIYYKSPSRLLGLIKETAKRLYEVSGIEIEFEKIDAETVMVKARFPEKELKTPKELSCAASECRCANFADGKSRCSRCGDPSNPVCKRCALDATRFADPKLPPRPPKTQPIPWYVPKEVEAWRRQRRT